MVGEASERFCGGAALAHDSIGFRPRVFSSVTGPNKRSGQAPDHGHNDGGKDGGRKRHARRFASGSETCFTSSV